MTGTITTPGLTGLRAPFPAHQISRLPKPTKAQTDAVKNDFKQGVRCDICGTWHHPKVVHLDYVGHAALTNRLLDVDPNWSWEPVPDPVAHGFPVVPGGMWIKLTVEGVSRYGFGCADGKTGGDAIKEVIGDALRNAAMRFGAALDLWHKGDLHVEDAVEEPAAAPAPAPAPRHDPATPALITDEQRGQLMTLANSKNIDARTICEVGEIPSISQMPASKFKAAMSWLTKQPVRDLAPAGGAKSDLIDDEIPY